MRKKIGRVTCRKTDKKSKKIINRDTKYGRNKASQ